METFAPVTLPPTALKAFPLKVRVDDTLHEVYMFLNEDGELKGFSHPDIMAHWTQRFEVHKVETASITAEQARDVRLFVETQPCWFEGCEELRAAYFREIEEAKQRNPGCKTGCEKSPIMRKYLKLAAEAQA